MTRIHDETQQAPPDHDRHAPTVSEATAQILYMFGLAELTGALLYGVTR